MVASQAGAQISEQGCFKIKVKNSNAIYWSEPGCNTKLEAKSLPWQKKAAPINVDLEVTDPVEPNPVEPNPVEPSPVEADPVEPDPVTPVEPDRCTGRCQAPGQNK